jgi:hypothetical protein
MRIDFSLLLLGVYSVNLGGVLGKLSVIWSDSLVGILQSIGRALLKISRLSSCLDRLLDWSNHQRIVGSSHDMSIEDISRVHGLVTQPLVIRFVQQFDLIGSGSVDKFDESRNRWQLSRFMQENLNFFGLW